MRIRIKNELLPIVLLVILLIAAIIFFHSSVLRIILGIPFLLFLPGYTLIAALFPKRKEVGGIERVALSFGVSIITVPLIGLILNYTPWGIRLDSILWSITSFILITLAIAWFRRRRLSQEERFGVEFKLEMPMWGTGIYSKVVSIILVIAILGALGMLGYVIAKSGVGERFTEFYILGQEGEATAYSQELRVGEEGRVIIGIVNHEYEVVNYRLEVKIDGIKNNEVEGLSLDNDGKWESEVSFTPNIAGEKQKVEFLLFKNGEVQPSVNLYIWIDVIK